MTLGTLRDCRRGLLCQCGHPADWHAYSNVQFCVVPGCGCLQLCLADRKLDTVGRSEVKQTCSPVEHQWPCLHSQHRANAAIRFRFTAPTIVTGWAADVKPSTLFPRIRRQYPGQLCR